MLLIPAFELGMWNAWIFILPVIILSIFGYRILGKRGSPGFSDHTKKESERVTLSTSRLKLLYGLEARKTVLLCRTYQP